MGVGPKMNHYSLIFLVFWVMSLQLGFVMSGGWDFGLGMIFGTNSHGFKKVRLSCK